MDKSDSKRILLIDDRLGFYGTAKFFERKLNQILSEKGQKYFFEIIPERFISRAEFRLKTEPFDAMLLDLDFSHNEGKEYFKDKPKDKRIWETLGQIVLLKEIRPNFPALPVIVFTSKTPADRILSKAAEFYLLGKASFFNKERLLEDAGWNELLDILMELLTEYEQSFKDKLEVDEKRKEVELEARNRDFMQTYLWQKLAESVYYKKFYKQKEKKIGVVFFDMDRMKKLNDAFGYRGTNKILSEFVKKIKDFIDKNAAGNGVQYEIGRFFRERGDEFLIIYSGEIDKDKLISHLYELKDFVNSKEFQKEVFNADPDKYGLKITSSMGLFVFPDDLKYKEYAEWKRISKLEGDDLQKFVDESYRQMTEIPQKLKDSAKKLGRNQFCYYQSNKTNFFQKNKEYYSPRVVVKVEKRGAEVDLSELKGLLEFIFGDLAFEFITAEEKCGRPVLLKVSLNKKGILKISKNKRSRLKVEVEGVGSYLSADASKVLEIKDEKLKRELILNTPILRKIHNAFFEILRKIARELGNEQLFPRETIVDEIKKSFSKIKEEFILYKGKSPKKISPDSDLTFLKEFYEGIKISPEGGIWISERKSNKEGKYKHALVATFEITPTSYGFLISESGRNMMKFQNFLEGYIKGFAKTHPDGKYTEDLIEIIYRGNPTRKHEEKQKSLFVCRHSLFSPVDPIVYNELIAIDRVRLDFKISNDGEAGSQSSPNVIQHISFDEAKEADIVLENSPVDKFVKKYKLNNTFKIVVYNGSEMIGPSIQLAEAAGFLAEIFLKKHNEISVLDIFSGSSSTLIPIYSRILENKKNLKKAVLLRIDANKPKEDLLENVKSTVSPRDKIDYPYIEGTFDFENCEIKIGDRNFTYKSFFEEYLKEKLNNKDKLDLTIADPPHIFSIPFLFNKKNGRSLTDILAENSKIFIVYYAHKEQIQLCKYIRDNLSKAFDHVWRLTIAGEEMAICTQHDYAGDIESKLKELKKSIESDYYDKQNQVSYEKEQIHKK